MSRLLIRAFGAVVVLGSVTSAAVAAAQVPVRVGGMVQEPKKIVHVEPAYPPMAKSARVQGTVIIEATIDDQGNVRDARLLRSQPLFDDAAVDAVRQWKYTPTLLNGQPVEVVMTVAVNFALKGDSQPVQAPAATAANVDALVDMAKALRAKGLLDEAARRLQQALDQVNLEKAAAGAQPADPVRVGGGVQEPRKIRTVDPTYPQQAKDDKLSGTVILEAIIAKDGTVREVRVLRSNPMFDAAASDAVKQWVYSPTLLNGVPVEVIMTVVVNFVLK